MFYFPLLRSATKNLGLSYWRISQTIDQNIEKNEREITFYFKEALKYLSVAYETGEKSGKKHNHHWMAEVGNHIENVLSEATSYINEHSADVKVWVMYNRAIYSYSMHNLNLLFPKTKWL